MSFARLLSAVLLAVVPVGVRAQSELVWDFGAAAPGLATPGSGLPAEVTGGVMTRGNNNGTTALLATTSASNTYRGATGQYNAGAAARTGTLNRDAGGSADFEFTLAPVPGRQLAIRALTFGSRSTGTGPVAYALFTSADGFGAPVATGPLPCATWALVAPVLTGPAAGPSGTPLTVRIYGHGGTGNPPAGTANWRIDDLAVSITSGAGLPVAEAAHGSPTMAGDRAASFPVATPPASKRIHEVQGAGLASPLVGEKVALEAVVTGFVAGAMGRDGFYIQEEDTKTDADPATSEGIYVRAPGHPGAATLTLGDRVSVTGTVTEFNGLTELTGLVDLARVGAAPLPAAVEVVLPAASATALERYEGMRVTFPQTLTVSGNRNLGQYGELVLSASGRLMQPTNFIDPNDQPASGTTSTGGGNVAAVIAQQTANTLSSIVLDDASTASYPAVTPYLSSGDTLTATRRTGDTVTHLTGVLGYRFNAYRVDPQADAPVTFVNSNPRPLTPPSVGAANVRVGSANVLNYFLTPAPPGRGANTTEERLRQRAKMLAGLAAMNADVFGLMEIERRADNAPLADLVAGLNDIFGAGTYAPIDSSAIAGTDSIQVALIYKPAVVTPVGIPLTDTAPGASIHNRPPLAQTFALTANGGKFTVVVNHFKSKASGSGADADQRDGQAASNITRKAQAAMLAAFLADPVATFGDPDGLIIGDLNAYAEEDPIDILRAAGFSDQLARFHPAGTYSYQFGSQFGYLDHALASASLAAQITGASKWHVNADEPPYYDYNTENKTAAQQAINAGTPFRASDHDPAIIGLKLAPPTPAGAGDGR